LTLSAEQPIAGISIYKKRSSSSELQLSAVVVNTKLPER